MIEFKNVSKVYANGTHALNDVNINIEAGEFVFVVGASGAGKSTFLKLIMREEVPSSGTINIKDYKLNELSRRQIPYFRRSMGIVFQDFRLIPNMTVYDNVAFAMRVIGAKEKKIRKRVPYVISLVGLASKARCMPLELSGGEQQRVALARALANNADIIIADEPTGNVDPQMSFEIVELLTRLNEAGTTVVMVTHEHNLVRRFNRRVIILENGSVVFDGMNFSGKAVKASRGHLEGHVRSAVGDKIENSAPESDESAEDDLNVTDAVASIIAGRRAAREKTVVPEKKIIMPAAASDIKPEPAVEAVSPKPEVAPSTVYSSPFADADDDDFTVINLDEGGGAR